MEKENDKIATCKTMIKMVNLEVNLDAPIGINWVRKIALNFEKIWSPNLIESNIGKKIRLLIRCMFKFFFEIVSTYGV